MKKILALAIGSMLLMGAGCMSLSTPTPRPTPTPIPSPTPMPPEEPVFCTQDAKQCPDGSYVARHGPNCEFDACPGEIVR
ncbi:MAG: hypothetical protein WC813_04495 [Patescibacteria group bacterium]